MSPVERSEIGETAACVKRSQMFSPLPVSGKIILFVFRYQWSATQWNLYYLVIR